jgi:anaerobic magnesium-protoporphyrin IX monomethyl ester cyclase
MPKIKVVLLSTVQVDDLSGGKLRMMPLSILALGSALLKEGFEPVLIDAQVEPNWQKVSRDHLNDALLFGISCMTGPSILSVLEAVRIARDNFPEVPIVWGGYHATQAYPSIFAEGLVDYVVRGPGEEAIVELAHALQRYQNPLSLSARLTDVPNLVFEQDSKLVVNPFKPIADVNDLPPMNYSLIDVNKYYSGQYKRLQYVTSYGCPYRCAFCVEPAQHARQWKALNPQRVVDEVISLCQEYEPERIDFVDANFSSNPKRVVEIVKEMARRRAHIELVCDMRPGDVLNIAGLTSLRALREAGFAEIWLGLESGSDRMLRILKKDLRAADALAACRALDETGIQTNVGFLHDIPGETLEDSNETFELIENLCQLQHNRQLHHWCMPYPATEVFDELFRDTDAGDAQLEWAASSTYWGSKLWSGRPEFRRTVLRKLFALKKKYPSTFQYPSALPVLRRIRFTAGPAVSD